MRLRTVVDDYMALGQARRGDRLHLSHDRLRCDSETLHEDIPALVARGMARSRLFMTYDRLKVDDEPLLDVLLAARKCGAIVCVHAENHGMIAWMGQRLIEAVTSHRSFMPLAIRAASETEAINRLILCAELLDQPV